MPYPSNKQIMNVLRELDKKEKAGELFSSLIIPDNVGPLEQMKYKVCRNILSLKNKYELSNTDIGNMMGISKHEVSKIVNYHFDKFTFDRLIQLYAVLIESMDDEKLVRDFQKQIRSFLEIKSLRMG